MSKPNAFVAIAAALLASGCGPLPVNIPALLATPTTIPSSTAVAATWTSIPAATETPTIATPTQTPLTFTPIATFTETSVATSASPASPAGTAIGYGNVTLLLPGSLGSDTVNTAGADVEFPYTSPSNGVMPRHIRFVISGYPVQDSLLQPQILIFPAEQYAQYSDYTRQLITALQTMQYYDGQPLPQGLPDGAFNAHVAAVQFANGRGIRYLTQFDQSPLPVNNRELIYFFHGLTTAGDSYVEAVLPVQAAYLAPDGSLNSPLPAGGIPFRMDALDKYFQDISNKLNATPPDDFSPPLSVLDSLIQSIDVGVTQ